MLHAATMTASHFHRSEVATWQLHAAALTATHWGFPVGVTKGFRKQRYGYGSSVEFRASADLLRSFRELREPADAFRITCMTGPRAQEDMLLKAFEWLPSGLQSCG